MTKDGSSNLARVRIPMMARMSLPLRASNEGPLRPRVARAQGTHRAISPPAGGIFQHPAECAVQYRRAHVKETTLAARMNARTFS